MLVEIVDLKADSAYVARCREDCHDETDRNVYDLVCSLLQPIKMGSVMGSCVVAEDLMADSFEAWSASSSQR